VASTNIQHSVADVLSNYLRATPQAIAVLIVAFLSGHLWVYIITAYLRRNTKGNRLLQSTAGRIAIGMAWLAVVMIPVYFTEYGTWPADYGNILAIVIPTIVLALFAQVVIFGLFVSRG
jgi:hypothetical protein